MGQYKIKPEGDAAFTNLRYSMGTEGDHIVFAPYIEMGATIQIKKGTVLEVDSAHPHYGDSGKTKVFYKVIRINVPNPPRLPKVDLYVYKNDGELVA